LTSKVHLVPFGEYLPFKSLLLKFFQKVVARYGTGDFSPGPGRTPLTYAGPEGAMRFGVLICFESLFPQYAAELARRGSEFLTVITLDAWFGTTAAPAQHAIFSAFRAAENGRWLVRAAATGISAVYDPTGRRVAEQPLHTRGALAWTVRGRQALTTYSRWGAWWVWVCLGLCIWHACAFRKKVQESPMSVLT
jgi:apolipoprotein N-acyltransferase